MVTPILGASLLPAALSKEQPSVSASSGCTTIDELALQGGFRYGEITTISGASGTGKTTLAFHAIASHLLDNSKGDVAIVDTKGTFSPVRLRDVLAARLHEKRRRTTYQEAGYVYEKRPLIQPSIGEDLVEEATSILDRVKVMRIFDVAGLVEAVGEIAELCDNVEAISIQSEVSRETGKRIVADSEAESEEDDQVTPYSLKTKGREHSSDLENHGKLSAIDGTIGMIVIDTITTVFGPLMTKSQVQGQAMLTAFMRSLHHLTTRRHLCTLLTNSIVGLSNSMNPGYSRPPQDGASVFPSIVGKPALGKSFTYLIDTSVLLSTLPKTVEDAEAAHGDQNEDRQAQYFGIFEILQDKHSTRAERWAAFKLVDGTTIRPVENRRY